MLISRHDFLYAIRSARRAPFLTLIVIIALSVGIGLNTGVFTILNYLFLQSPTRVDPATFVQLYPRYQGWFTGADQYSSFTAGDYEAIRAQTHALANVAAWTPMGVTLGSASKPVSSMLVTCNYFQVYGITHPLLGRFFLQQECKPGAPIRVAVLNQFDWKRLFAADPHIIGKTIEINRQPFTVIGVMPSDAAGYMPGGLLMPYSVQPILDHGNDFFHNPDQPWLSIDARLKPGSSRSNATAEIDTILHQRDRLYLDHGPSMLDRKTSVALTNGSFIETPSARSVLVGLMFLIMGPLFLVLLLACTNVTILFLSRSVVRRGETAIRIALGTSRARLVRMLSLESFLTAALAGIISVYLTYRVPVLIMNAIDPSEAKFAPTIKPDWAVFAYTAALVLAAAIISALAPVRESFRIDLVTALKGREGTSTMRSRTTSAFIIVQIAMGFVLIAAAVLFARLPGKLVSMNSGFDTRQIMPVPLDLGSPHYTQASALAFHHSLDARILQIPGVQSLSYATLEPFRGVAPIEVRLPGQTAQGRPASVDDVSSNFFSTFGIQMLRGRSFQSSDLSATTAASVAVVSRSFAKAFWGSSNPIGKTLITPDNERLIVIGIAADTRSEQYGILDGPRLYTLRNPQSIDGELYVRFSGNAAPIAAAIEAVIKNLDPDQAGTPLTIWEHLESVSRQMSDLAEIILFMAGIAVLLAVTGVFAVLTFVISQRTREFGIQMVLGATRQSIFRSVMLRGLRQIGIGLCFGVALAAPAAWALAFTFKRSLVHIQVLDPIVYGIAAITIVIVSLLAMYLPALRATQVDPIQALRNE